jgi:hypothetical protein
MNMCFEYVGLVKWWVSLDAGAKADWVSAIGTVAAIGLTAIIYTVDKVGAIRKRRADAGETRRKRLGEMVIRARLVAPGLLHANETINVMGAYLTAKDVSGFDSRVPIAVAGVEQIVEAAPDLTLFEPVFAKRLAELIGYARLFNAVFAVRCSGARNMKAADEMGYPIRDAEVLASINNLRIAVEACLSELGKISADW